MRDGASRGDAGATTDGLARTQASGDPALERTAASGDPALDGTLASGDPALDGTVASGPVAPHGAGGEALPRQVGRYAVRRELGRGGMGVVYAAHDPDLDRDVAVKLLRPALARHGDDAAARMLREARTVARLAHPNVVAVFEVGTDDAGVFLAMELVVGQALDAWLAAQRRPWREVAEVFAQVGQGLIAAHAAGIVHRDIKPANILLGRDGRARITDFGVAHLGEPHGAGAGGSSARDADERLTATGALVGTPAYMAPEQLEAGPVDARTDQFSFAVALYEALYGERPFAGRTFAALADAVLAGEIRPAPAGTSVPAWVRVVVVRALARAPADRYPTLDAMLVALAADPTRRRRRVALAGGLVVAGFGAAAILVGERAAAPGNGACLTRAAALLAPWDEVRATVVAAVRDGLDRRALVLRAVAVQACVAPDPDPARAGLQQACLASQADRLLRTVAQVRVPLAAAQADVLATFAEPAKSPGCLTAPLRSYPQPLPVEPPRRALVLDAMTRAWTAELTRIGGGALDEAERAAREGVELAARAEHAPTHAETLSSLGAVLLERGDGAGADAAWLKALTEAERGEAFELIGRLHVLRANRLCNIPGRIAECEAEIERAHIHATRHPDIDPRELTLVAAGFEAARLRAEVGFAGLEAYLAQRPDAAMDPYVVEQYAAVAELDGRPRQGLARIDAALAGAGPISVGVRTYLLAARCRLAIAAGEPALAAATRAELATLVGADPGAGGHELVCGRDLAVLRGDLEAARALEIQRAATHPEAPGGALVLLLAAGRGAEARALLGPRTPGRRDAVLDWDSLPALLEHVYVALAADDRAAARALLDEAAAGLSTVPPAAFAWLQVHQLRAILEVRAGALPAAAAELARIDAILAARAPDGPLADRRSRDVIEAELCARGGGPDCAAPLRAHSAAPGRAPRYLELLAAVLVAEAEHGAGAADACARLRAAWAELSALSGESDRPLLDASRLARACGPLPPRRR